MKSDKIWAITCLFNPAGFSIRTENYRHFRAFLPLNLITVELAFDGPFSLQKGDADHLIQLRGGDVMWQKERLLNLAVQALPHHVEKVVWIDADVLLPGQHWVDQVEQALDTTPILQPFATVRHIKEGEEQPVTRSTMGALAANTDLEQVMDSTLNRGGAPCSGYVWAARRELLHSHGLYDGCIVGGGDTAWLCAATGNFSTAIKMHSMTARQAVRYLDWARPLYEDVQGQVGFLPAQIEHLWHGAWADRRGRQRHKILTEADFDPFTDITLNADGVWKWNSNKPNLHREVADYFRSRNEDSHLLPVNA